MPQLREGNQTHPQDWAVVSCSRKYKYDINSLEQVIIKHYNKFYIHAISFYLNGKIPSRSFVLTDRICFQEQAQNDTTDSETIRYQRKKKRELGRNFKKHLNFSKSRELRHNFEQRRNKFFSGIVLKRFRNTVSLLKRNYNKRYFRTSPTIPRKRDNRNKPSKPSKLQ